MRATVAQRAQVAEGIGVHELDLRAVERVGGEILARDFE